jgi:uncharacterized membrane protein
MASANAASSPAADEIFSAVLTPQRSLGPRGFAWVMAGLGGLSLAIGATFLALGAWPVPGFVGLDVLAVFLAFRLNYRSGRAAEEITVSRARLTVRQISARGAARVSDLNPYWARLVVHRQPPFGITGMAITSHGHTLPIGGFLGPDERETLATALSAALAEARAGAAP